MGLLSKYHKEPFLCSQCNKICVRVYLDKGTLEFVEDSKGKIELIIEQASISYKNLYKFHPCKGNP